MCNVISADSRVFQLAAKGDMSSVLEHFKYGLATLHDVDEYGWGIFDVGSPSNLLYHYLRKVMSVAN